MSEEAAGVRAVDQPMVVAELRSHIGGIAIASSMTTARFSIVPTPRIATCGWLMSGRP